MHTLVDLTLPIILNAVAATDALNAGKHVVVEETPLNVKQQDALANLL